MNSTIENKEIENKDQLSPTEVEIRTEFGNMSVSHQNIIIWCRHVRDASLMHASRGVLNDMISERCI